MALAPHERLRGIFHPTQYHFHMDPTGAIEQWNTVEQALDAFAQRASGRRARTYYLDPELRLGVQVGWDDGYDTGDTAFMDVWIADKDDEPGVPDTLWQRWRLAGADVQRDNF